MAKFLSTTFGKITGKHGTAVGSTRNGESILRVYTKPTDPRTEAQLATRAKFTYVVQLLHPFRPVFNDTYGRGQKGFGQAFKLAYAQAVYPEFSEFMHDWSKVLLSQGNLMVPPRVSATFATPSSLRVDWDTTVYSNGSEYDNFSVVLYNENTRAMIYVKAAGVRNDGTFNFELPDNWDQNDLSVWLLFFNMRNNQYSNSYYMKPEKVS